MLPIYLRKEPTTDPILLKCLGTLPGVARFDVVAYADETCAIAKARWSWWQKRPDRRFKRVTLNCYLWRAVWMPALS